jgi:hypothetical protein
MINTFKAKTSKIGYTVKFVFQIAVHRSDINILYASLREDAGHITYANMYAYYKVENFADIRDIIVPHFSYYPLQSTKFTPFYLFKAAVEIVDRKEHLNLEGYRKLLSFKASLKKGKGKGVTATIFQSELFSDIVPFNTEGIFIQKNTALVPEFIAGFVAADGTFFISKPSVKAKWANYDATFAISQNQRDEGLLKRIIMTLGCGSLKKDSHGMLQVSVRNKKELPLVVLPLWVELQEIIVPFFSKYLINTEKAKDFKDFSTSVSILYANKSKGLKNLTPEQIKQLDYCISSMNKNRYNPKVSDADTDTNPHILFLCMPFYELPVLLP